MDSAGQPIADLYRRVSAAWMWASVYDNARFVLQKYTARATANERKTAAALLERLATFAQLKTGTSCPPYGFGTLSVALIMALPLAA